jgi:heme oxygenase
MPAWEEAVNAALTPACNDWFAQHLRSPLLAHDLAHLDGQAPPPAVQVLRLELSSLPAALGSLYVLEVLDLAGQLVARQAEERHGLGPDNGAAFFNGCGAASAGRWREFRQWIDRDVKGHEATLQACTAASLTADALSRSLRPLQVAPGQA